MDGAKQTSSKPKRNSRFLQSSGSLGTAAFAHVPSMAAGGQRCLGGQVGEGVGGSRRKAAGWPLSGEGLGRETQHNFGLCCHIPCLSRSTGEVGVAVPAVPLDI